MAAVTLRGSLWNTTAGVKTTASFSPASGELLVAVVGVGGTDTAPVMSDSKSGAWTLVDSFRSYGSAITGGLRVYTRNSAVDGTSMTVTVTPSGDAGGGLVVLSVTDPGAFGASAVRSTGGQADQAAGTPAPVLSSTPLSKNPIIVAVLTQTNGSANAAPRSSPAYSEQFDAGFNTPPSGLEVQSVNSGETTATLTTGGATPSGFAAIGIEVATVTRVALTNAAETDAAQSVAFTKPIRKTLTPATSTDAAVALAFTKPLRKTVTAAAESDVAQAVAFTQPAAQHITITPATETDAAQTAAFTKPIRKTLTPATETEAAQAISFTKPIRKALGGATEADAAQGLGFTKPLRTTVTPATESDLGLAMTRSTGSQNVGITPALESDAAAAVSFTKPIRVTLTPGASTNAAVGIVVSKAALLVPASEIDAGVSVAIIHAIRVSVVAAMESDSATVLVRLIPDAPYQQGRSSVNSIVARDDAPTPQVIVGRRRR